MNGSLLIKNKLNTNFEKHHFDAQTMQSLNSNIPNIWETTFNQKKNRNEE